MSEKKILCVGKEERDAVLKKLEEQGVRWAGGHERPTEWKSDGWGENSEIVLAVEDNNDLYWGRTYYYKDKGEKLIPAKEYLGQFKTKPILIYRNDDLVTAVDKNTGFFRSTLCSDDDTFDFYTGAMIALCRLVDGRIGEDAKAEMRKLLGEEKKPEDDKIEVGSMVMVTNPNAAFMIYTNWFVINKIDTELAARYAFDRLPLAGKHCVVKAIHPHELSSYGDVYLVEADDDGIRSECYLIGRKGIKKI